MRSDLPKADALIFGMPTRYGTAASQVRAFIDSTGALWASGALVGASQHAARARLSSSVSLQAGKIGATFVSTATLGGGQVFARSAPAGRSVLAERHVQRKPLPTRCCRFSRITAW